MLPAKVLAPLTASADTLTELVIAAPEAIVSEVKVAVPEYCRSSVAPESIETALLPRAAVVGATRVPALIVVLPE